MRTTTIPRRWYVYSLIDSNRFTGWSINTGVVGAQSMEDAESIARKDAPESTRDGTFKAIELSPTVLVRALVESRAWYARELGRSDDDGERGV
jgi:hypothetical protein